MVATGAPEVGMHAVDLARGKIDDNQPSEKAAATVMTSGCAWAGAAAGAFALSWLGWCRGGIGRGILGAMGMEESLAA